MENENIAKVLNGGGIAVVPTDTLYGIVGKAADQKAVDRIYKIKHRDDNKKLILLISSVEQLADFGVKLTKPELLFLESVWPGPNTVELSVSSTPRYLDKGTARNAFRLPDNSELTQLIDLTGPLVAPSANPQGSSPALTIPEAKAYFGNKIDYYQDAGRLESEPSQLWVQAADGSFQKIKRS